MGAKKKKGGKGKKGKKGGIDPDDLKAFNLSERTAIIDLYDRMEDLKERSDELKEQKSELEERFAMKLEHNVSYQKAVINIFFVI